MHLAFQNRNVYSLRTNFLTFATAFDVASSHVVAETCFRLRFRQVSELGFGLADLLSPLPTKGV